ncbi:hypothetical protein [Myxococcus sp. RHSTA-1-4]|uniref:hypothetical protein n=1 Tax=Myxococcus sp. RHSTA-1-4 TaxID=2874601 RepID=UPI001CBBD1E2|nr:hypothetical protein [Myxococcus sp. RHSTA-1-4]MBZ4422879.1 hypothetical protein [Myxococcus sp. RHSTA-1-4]
MDVLPPLPDFSVMRGGPLYKAELRLLRIRSRRSNVRWLTLAFVLVAWLPLVVLTLPRGAVVTSSLLSHLHVQVQFLLALPVLVAAEPFVDRYLTLAARQFLRSHLVGADSRPAYEAAARAAMRWRDSSLVEAGLLAVSLALALSARLGTDHAWSSRGAEDGPSPAGWWYLLVSQPILRFLLLRWFWRGIVWAGFLFRVSRLPLALVPTHPDVMGGLGFLPICQAQFAPVVFALSAVASSYTWRAERAGISTDPMPYLVPHIVFAVISVVVVFSPMIFFSRHLILAKRRGFPRFSSLAASHSRRFEWKWFRERPDQDPLGAPDFSSMIDLGSSFSVSRDMRLFPWDRRSLTAVILAALAPMLLLLTLDRRLLAVLIHLREGLR